MEGFGFFFFKFFFFWVSYNFASVVTRKLAELGYHRSAKKCKEKFENVFKYHKRTKEGRASKGPGKTYRFFDQLEAFRHHSLPSPASSSPTPPPHHTQAPPPPLAAAALSMPPVANITTAAAAATTVPSTTHMQPVDLTTKIIPSFPTTNPTILAPVNPMNPSQTHIPSSYQNIPTGLLSNSTSSSSTSSDLELEGTRRRKRRWRDFFERLMREVVEKQEELQKKFLEAIEKREHERMVREEAWRVQETTRINREREILAQERSIAAAKDAAVMAFLQKLSDQQQNPAAQVTNNPPPSQPPATTPAASPPPQPAPPPQLAPAAASQQLSQQLVLNLGILNKNNDNGGGDRNNSLMPQSSSRWPKVEVQALIDLRTNLDSKYQENGPKGPLWEEISAGMRKLGYNRSSKRCKEKWENINKYFKKVKESNKKRTEDSKTCPYFHQLDALYRERNKFDSSSIQLKPENSVPLMVRPEQQWPPQPEHHNRQDSTMEDVESDHNLDEDDKDIGDDDEDEEGGGFEVVPNKQVSLDTTE